MPTLLEPRIGNLQPAGDAWLATDYRFPYPTKHGLDDYLALFERFALSEHGRHQSTQPPRYSVDFGHPGLAKDAGADAHPVEHMWFTYTLVRQLLAAELLKYERLEESPGDHFPRGSELVVARFATLTHDIGECTHEELLRTAGGVVGDIPFGHKTARHKAIEASVRNVLFRQHYGDLPDELLARSEQIISHQDNSPTHDVYQVSHDSGAYMTSVRMGSLALANRGDPGDEAQAKRRAFALQVSARAYAAIEPWANTYEFVDNLLCSTDATFTAIHNQL